jgi:hypothetical protein
MSTTTLPAITARPSPFATLTATAVVLLVITLIWAQADPRLLDGVPVWMKPAKFAMSFVVHFGTLALIAAALSPARQASRAITLAAGIMAVAFLGEMAYLFLQAAKAEHSHFNLSTPFHFAAYQIMGFGAVLLIGLPIVIARAAATDAQASIGPATRSGIWWGALMSFALTLIVAGYMSNGTGHFVGTPSAHAPTLPLFGWSAEVGDLRPSHFLSLHALQGLPLLGLWLDRTGRGVALIRPAAAIWAVATLAVFAQALMGLPLIAL